MISDMASTRHHDVHAWYDAHLATVLRRPGPPVRVLLAIACRAIAGGHDAPTGHDNPAVLRTWLLQRLPATSPIRALAASSTYPSLHTAASRHVTRTGSHHLDPPAAANRHAMSLVASLLVPVSVSAPDGRRRNRLAAPVTALVGLEILGGEKRWDTALVTYPKLAVHLGCSAPRARAALRRAVDDSMLSVVSERPGGGKRVRIPSRLTPDAELVAWAHPETVAAVASWRAGDPLPEDPTAAVISSVLHPAWGYGEWVDGRSGKPVDGWDVWVVTLAMVSGADPIELTGFAGRSARRVARIAGDFGLGFGGDELARILDQVAADSAAVARRGEAEGARRRAAKERAAAVAEHRVSRHVHALVGAIGELPGDIDSRRAWTAAAVEWAGARLIRPASDRLAVVAATGAMLVEFGVEGERARRIASAIWTRPDSASDRAA
jgi:hypothetical protein